MSETYCKHFPKDPYEQFPPRCQRFAGHDPETEPHYAGAYGQWVSYWDDEGRPLIREASDDG